MKNRTVRIAALLLTGAALMWSLSGCGQRINTVQTETETESETQAKQTETTAPPVTEKETETEVQSETQKLITSVDYTSKDGSVKITLPDNTWKVTQDADEMRVFQSGNAAIINIVHANTDTALKNLSVLTSQQALDESLKSQYTKPDDYEIQEFTATNVNNINLYRYTVKYNAAARMWAYSVTNAVVASDQAYVVTGTVTDDNKTLLDSVKKAVESFQVLGDSTLKSVTGKVITGTTQKTSETVNPNTGSTQELTSLSDYGTTVTLVTTDTVNMRSQPGTDSSIMTTLTPKTNVSVVGETKNWFKVNIGGNIGYIRKDFLVYGNTTSSETTATEAAGGNTSAPSSAELGTATTYGSATSLYASADVNIRTAPGTDSAVAGSLGKGTSVSVIGETDNWFIVSVGGQTGYVSKGYLTYDSSVSNGTSASSENISGGGGSSSGSGSGSGSSSASPSAVSGTVTGTTVDSITVAGDDGNTYTIYYGDASVSSSDGLYSGVHVNVNLDTAQAAGDGTLYATSVVGN